MNITIYCGANIGNKDVYSQKAKEVAQWIANNHYTLVYGGGNVGLMGIVSNEVLANGGKVIGVIPKFLVDRELANPQVTELIVVESMPERKQCMIDKGNVFIALPGGPGTLEEIAEVISWARIGQNDKPCILFNVDGYYNSLEKMYDDMVTNGFLSKADRNKVLFSDNVKEIEEFIAAYEAPDVRAY